MDNVELAFQQEIAGLYYKIKTDTGYIANNFRQAVQTKGGLKAAKDWLADPNATDELFKLMKLKRLDLSMENLVLRKKYKSLFSEEELATAKKRLASLGFTPAEEA